MSVIQFIEGLGLVALDGVSGDQAVVESLKWWLLGWAFAWSLAVPCWAIALIKRAGSAGD